MPVRPIEAIVLVPYTKKQLIDSLGLDLSKVSPDFIDRVWRRTLEIYETRFDVEHVWVVLIPEWTTIYEDVTSY